MANNKDKMKSGSQGSIGNQPDQFEGQGSQKNAGPSGQEHKQGSGKHGQQTGGSQGNFDDDDMKTAGGREGKFSDTQSGSGQWSPGSGQESDR